MSRGAAARARRTAHRAVAASRGDVTGVGKARDMAPEINDLDAQRRLASLRLQAHGEFAASGLTSLPMSDREMAWDSAAADANVRAYASSDGSGDADTIDWPKYATAFFWKDPANTEMFGGYKLGFADVIDGELTSVWKGVTAVAGVLMGARGGVDIPEEDMAGVKNKVAAYYRKAAKMYKDDMINAPWETASDTNVAEFGATANCGCGHYYSEHLGATGTCGHMDGRGTCSCSAFREMALVAAAGDVVWMPEEGIAELMYDIAEQLGDSYYVQDIDVMVTKALVSYYPDIDGECETLVIPFTIDAMMEPVVSPYTEWVAAERAWVEDAGEAMEAASNRRTSAMLASLEELQVDMHDLPEGEINWQAVIAPEGKLTDDGRAFAPESLTWRELPLTLMGMVQTADGHDGAVVCGRIDRIWRDENVIRAEGIFDSGEFGQEVARMVADQTLRGVSVDIAVHEYEVGAKTDWFTEDGKWSPKEMLADEDQADMLDLMFGGDSVFVVTNGVIGAVTVCPFQAFEDATIALAASLVAAGATPPSVWTSTVQGGFVLTADCGCGGMTVETEEVEVLTASAAGLAPELPPSDWFVNPDFSELTPLVVTDDGRVYGHAAAWGTCHIGIPDVCTTPPTTETGYAYYHLGEVLCDDGERIACGQITLDTGHAPNSLGRAAAAAHYDNTGTAVADVVCGEDEHGIWFAGAVRADADSNQVRKLRGAKLSGDWRAVNGNLELCGLLAVNVPGFPIPRPKALVSSASDGESPRVLALVAAGIHDGPITDEMTEEISRRFVALQEKASGKLAALAAQAHAERS